MEAVGCEHGHALSVQIPNCGGVCCLHSGHGVPSWCMDPSPGRGVPSWCRVPPLGWDTVSPGHRVPLWVLGSPFWAQGPFSGTASPLWVPGPPSWVWGPLSEQGPLLGTVSPFGCQAPFLGTGSQWGADSPSCHGATTQYLRCIPRRPPQGPPPHRLPGDAEGPAGHLPGLGGQQPPGRAGPAPRGAAGGLQQRRGAQPQPTGQRRGRPQLSAGGGAGGDAGGRGQLPPHRHQRVRHRGAAPLPPRAG